VLQMELQFDEADAVPAKELPAEENTVTITYTCHYIFISQN